MSDRAPEGEPTMREQLKRKILNDPDIENDAGNVPMPEGEPIEKLRIIDIEDFGDRALPIGGPFNEMVLSVQDAALSDPNGQAVVIPESEYVRQQEELERRYQSMMAAMKDNGSLVVRLISEEAKVTELEATVASQQREIGKLKHLAEMWQAETAVRDRQILEASEEIRKLREERLTPEENKAALFFVNGHEGNWPAEKVEFSMRSKLRSRLSGTQGN